MNKKKLKYYVYDVPVTIRYKIYAENEIEAKHKLIEQAGLSIDGELLFDKEDLEKAEAINN